MSNEADKLVLSLFEKVRAKQAEIKKAEKPRWITSCTIGVTENVQDRINIQTVTDVKKLISLYCFLLNLESTWSAAIKELEINEPCVWQGYKISDWKADIKARVQQIGINIKKKELEKMESDLESLTSEELRRNLKLEEIIKKLG